MTNPMIRVKNLCKRYQRINRSALSVKALLSGQRIHKSFEALNNVNFEINKGECVGIIGRNGAGKSTLLKILAGTLERSEGEIFVDGKIAAILELGSGFNPEYSGRENIVLGGLCLGMTQSEINSKIESIIDFSELREVIDRPFKTYSSGMQARLTFSTAISVSPDILIVDEALATGDIAFVEKCLLRIEAIVKSGTTVLLVSHNMNMISRFARRVLWIDKGRLVLDGMADRVIKEYEIDSYSMQLMEAEDSLLPQETLHMRVGAKIIACHLSGTEVKPNVFLQGKPLNVEVTIDSPEGVLEAVLSMQIYNLGGTLLWSASNLKHFDSSYRSNSSKLRLAKGVTKIQISLPQNFLNSGTHSISLSLSGSAHPRTIDEIYDLKPKVRYFAVVRKDSYILSKAFDTPSEWSLVSSSRDIQR